MRYQGVQLSAARLSKRFGRHTLFKDLSFEVSGGERLAVTGPNGSGKSTLLKILAGILSPGHGNVAVSIKGISVPPDRRCRHVGMVAPYLNLYEALTPRENLELIAKLRGMVLQAGSIERMLDDVGLLGRSNERLSTFSTGMKQRIRLAAASLVDAPVLLLDEPSATLDAAGIELVKNLVNTSAASGRVVVLATNVDSEVEAFDRELRLGS